MFVDQVIAECTRENLDDCSDEEYYDLVFGGGESVDDTEDNGCDADDPELGGPFDPDAVDIDGDGIPDASGVLPDYGDTAGYYDYSSEEAGEDADTIFGAGTGGAPAAGQPADTNPTKAPEPAAGQPAAADAAKKSGPTPPPAATKTVVIDTSKKQAKVVSQTPAPQPTPDEMDEAEFNRIVGLDSSPTPPQVIHTGQSTYTQLDQSATIEHDGQSYRIYRHEGTTDHEAFAYVNNQWVQVDTNPDGDWQFQTAAGALTNDPAAADHSTVLTSAHAEALPADQVSVAVETPDADSDGDGISDEMEQMMDDAISLADEQEEPDPDEADADAETPAATPASTTKKTRAEIREETWDADSRRQAEGAVTEAERMLAEVRADGTATPAEITAAEAELKTRREELSSARTASFMSDVNAAGGFLKYFLREEEGQRFARTVSRWAGYDEDNPACPTCVSFFHGWGYDAWADAACRSNLISEQGATFVSRSGYTSFSIEGEKKIVYPCGSDPDNLGDYSSSTGIVTLANGTEKNCAPYYDYKISGSAVPAEVAMEFDVYLNSDDNKNFDPAYDLHLYVDEDNETQRIKLNRSGASWSLAGANMFLYSSYFDFNKACIKFTSSSFDDLRMVISGVGKSGLLRDDDNPFCNNIVDAFVSQSLSEDDDDYSGLPELSPGGGISPESGCVGPSC